MWQISENVKLPPAAPESYIVDCSRQVADKIPQKFRSEELKAEPFCIEAFQQQEEFGFGFQNELQESPSNNSTKPQTEYATVNDGVFFNSSLTNPNQTNFVEQIPDEITHRWKEEQPIDEADIERQCFKDYDFQWNIVGWNHCEVTSPQIINSKPEQLSYFEEGVHPAIITPEKLISNTAEQTKDLDYSCEYLPVQNSCSEKTQELFAPVIPMSNIMQALPEVSKGFQESSSETSSENIQLPLSIAQPNEEFALEEAGSSSNISMKTLTNPCFNLRYAPGTLPTSGGQMVPESNNINQGSSTALQEFPHYNFYQRPIRNRENLSTVVGEERKFSQTGRDNQAIKFHIRTITHCEVECPAPGSLPLSNQPSPFLPLPAGDLQTHAGGQSLELNATGINRTNGGLSWDHLQSNAMESNENFTPQVMKEISQSNQILPFQSASYSNPFQNGGDCPRLLVHEQRQTSILIGYPSSANNNLQTSNQAGLQFNSPYDAPQSNRTTKAICQPVMEHNQNELQPQTQLVRGNDEQQRSQSVVDEPNRIAQPIKHTVPRENDVVRPKLPISTNQQDIPQSNQIPFIASTKPSQVNMHPSTYPTVLGFTPQPFPYLATNPSWLSAKQQPYSNFSSYPTPLDYFRPPSAAVNFNTNFKVKPNARRNLENKNTPFQPLSCHQFQNQPWPPNNSAMGYFPEKNLKLPSKRRSVTKRGNKSDKKTLQCSQCAKRFAKERELQVHINKHHRQLDKPYFCSFCSKSFKRPDQLKRHEKIHTGEKNHPCSICGRKFARTDHRNTHLKKHTIGGEEKFLNRKSIKAIEPDKVTPSRIFNENSVLPKEQAKGFLLPLRFDSPAAYPPYFINHPPALHDNQPQAFVPAVHL